MILQIRHHHIVVELIPVHLYQIQEDEVVVGIAVHYHRSAFCLGGILCGSVDCVHLESALSDNRSVFEYSRIMQVIVPGNNPGAQRIGFMAGALNIIYTVRGRFQGVIAHELAGQTSR